MHSATSGNTAGLTRALADWASGPGRETDCPDAMSMARSGFIDTIATLLAGAHEPVTDIVLQHLGGAPAPAEAPIPFADRLVGSAQAACINGVAAHALDYDDVAFGAHPSTVLVPALLAEGHRLDVSGAQLLRAYVAGFEIWAELFAREPDSYHVKGWHPTAVLGPLAAAAAVGVLHGVPAATLQTALAIAASHAGGLVANFGTMTKPLHAGRAAAAGVDAVRLALRGLTAAPDALEHHAGLLAALSPTGRARRDGEVGVGGPTPRLATTGLSVKRYPVCYSCHRVIDGVLALADRHGLQAGQVRAVRVRIGAAQASMLRNHRPVTALEAKFSVEFAVASALVAGGVGLAQLTDDFVNQPEVQSLMACVSIEIGDEVCPLDATFALNDRVSIDTHDGAVHASGDIRFPLGHARNPLPHADLRTKFMDCLAFGGWQSRAAQLLARIEHLETLPSVRDLFAPTAIAR